MDPADITAVGLPISGGFNLHAHEVPPGFDHHVVARRISQGLARRKPFLAARAINCSSDHSPRRLQFFM